MPQTQSEVSERPTDVYICLTRRKINEMLKASQRSRKAGGSGVIILYAKLSEKEYDSREGKAQVNMSSLQINDLVSE